MGISTHILDTSRGRPATGVAVTLERKDGSAWRTVTQAKTNDDGRVPALLPDGGAVERDTYRLRFDVAGYFERLGTASFFPVVEIAFTITEDGGHYHVPLLLSPFGYSTYRGS